MNDWDNIHNNCSVPQEADDTTSSNGSGSGSNGGNGGGGNGDFVGDGQLWTGAGAYRKIGQNKYSYRMLISTSHRQTSNTMRRAVQYQHANEFNSLASFVDTDIIWDRLYTEAKEEVRNQRRSARKETSSRDDDGPEESPSASGAESGVEQEDKEDKEDKEETTTSTSSSKSSSSSSSSPAKSSSSSKMSFKGKKYRNVGEKSSGQKIFSWSKIRAIGQHVAKSQATAAAATAAAAAAAASTKKPASKSRGGKKSKKTSTTKASAAAAAAAALSSPPSPSPADHCLVTMNVVHRLREEEQQCDVLMRILGRDENAPAVALDETQIKRALYVLLAASSEPHVRAYVADYMLISRQVLPLSGTLPSIASLQQKKTTMACKKLLAKSSSTTEDTILTLRLAELVRRGLVEVVKNGKTTEYKKRQTSSTFEPCASLSLKMLKPWKKSFATKHK